MEFWGVEVKPGQSLKVQPEFGKLIHISQAALGEVKDVKGAKYVPLRLKINDQKFVMGSLAAEDRPQVMFDMVFEKEFELSHDWKNGSVFFIGYIAEDPVSDGEEFSDDFEDDSEDELVAAPENGHVKPNAAGNAKAAKGAVAAIKAAAKKTEEPGSGEDEDDSDSDSDKVLVMGDDSSDGSLEDSEDEMDGSSSEEEELPKVQQQQSKKRQAESPKQVPVSAKKAKSDKPGFAPPSKAAGKSPESNKSKQQTPKSGGQFSQKSGGQFSQKSGNKSFNSKGKRGGK